LFDNSIFSQLTFLVLFVHKTQFSKISMSMNFLTYDFNATDLLTTEEEKKLESSSVSFRGRGAKKTEEKKTDEKKLAGTVYVPPPLPLARVDDRSPEELHVHSLAQDAPKLRKWIGWDLITPSQLVELKVGTWILQSKFINWKVKEQRCLCLCRLTGKSGNTLSFEKVKPREPNPKYTFVPRAWNLSWTDDSDRDAKLIGSSFRNFYVRS
jgi:hypothetical protein